MTSPVILENLNFSAESASAAQPEMGSANVTPDTTVAVESPLTLFLGVNHHIWLFTSARLLMLKGSRSLTRQLAGCQVIDFTDAMCSHGCEEILRRTRVRQEIPVSEISWIDAERNYSVGSVILFARGRRHELTVGQKRARLLPFVETLRARYEIPALAARQAMHRDLRVWAIFCVISGLLTFLLSFAYPGLLEPTWGLAVAAIGTGAWCMAEPAMFIVLGAGMVWAAVMNLFGLNSSLLNTGGPGAHLPLGVPLQLYWAGVLFARFQKYEHLYDCDKPADPAPGQSVGALWAKSSLLPLLSSGIAAAGIILLGLCLADIWRWPDALSATVSRGCLHLAMIGMALGIASLCSRHTRRGIAITGTTINAVMALTLLTLLITKWQQL